MIRSTHNDDFDVLVALIQQDKHMQTDAIIERLSKNKAWVFEDGVVKGCAVATALRSSPYGKRIDVWVYTAPEFRGQGVGQALWLEVEAQIVQSSPDIAVTGYRSDRGKADLFFAKRGFSYWFSSHSMSYDGGYFSETDLTPIPYAEAYFDEVIALINKGFYSLRETNGLTVLRRWRAAERAIPVLILTARDSWTEKVEGLNAGADDYLGKPFAMAELVARLNALIRRSNGVAKTELVFGEVRLDTAAQIGRASCRERV